jgi:hypothetical protein
MDITPPMLRAVGGFLELFGLYLIARGIYHLHRQFGGEPLPPAVVRRFLRRTWNRLTGRREPPVTLDIHGAVHGVSSATARLKVTPGAKSLEDKVAWLMREVDRLDDADARLSDQIHSESRERAQVVRQERESRAQSVQELRAEIKTLATGDLTRQFWGVIAFAFGIVFQVWAPEIARWV